MSQIDNTKKREFCVALAGNPNVGKSTVFNALTGMHQHTGNWTGKTVTNAVGYFERGDAKIQIIDLPGCYSLLPHSAEEEVARDLLIQKQPDKTVVVCDALCLERNLNLVFQVTELTPRVVVCVNLLDEAERKKVKINLEKLSGALGIPVVGTSARSGKGLDSLVKVLMADYKSEPPVIRYDGNIEAAVKLLLPAVNNVFGETGLNCRWISLRLLCRDNSALSAVASRFGINAYDKPGICDALSAAFKQLSDNGIDESGVCDLVAEGLVHNAERISKVTVEKQRAPSHERDRRIDRVVLSRWAGFPIMFALLAVLLWLTIAGANYPSELLGNMLFYLGDGISNLLSILGAPEWLRGCVVDGVWKSLAWVVSVMLPPMAIFFPLFTLLEDLGYLPRIAFSMDRAFKKCAACGKQCLTMCMGLGCNAAGVVGCRIIDSPRERLIAIITNNLIPCNGRFPILITIISAFFVGGLGYGGSVLGVLIMCAVIVMSVAMTLIISKLLSLTLLRGVPSSFTLELPPYRRPQIGKVIVRSVFDRTLFVLGRASAVAAPAGLVIWLLANVQADGASLLTLCAKTLQPLGKLMGLDGVILLAFILGIPANEIVIPIIVMAYTMNGSLTEIGSVFALRELLTANGWTAVTAINIVIFSVMHWPCSTTLMTIKKETGSIKWTVVSFLTPTVFGVLVCVAVNLLSRMI